MSIYGDEYQLEKMTFKELQVEYDKRLEEFQEARTKLITICQVKGGTPKVYKIE